MAINLPRQYLICYDIADPRRLARVHRYLSSRAAPLQYSVFTAFVTQKALEEILTAIEERISPRADDVRAYALPSSPRAVSIGRSYFPKGILLVEKGRDLLVPGEADRELAT